MKRLLLKNAKVVLPQETIRASLLLSNGNIAAIAGSKTTVSADKEIDLTGMMIFPGFIDLHIHGAVGVDLMDADPKRISEISSYLASQGVTGWIPTLVPASDNGYSGAVENIDKAMKRQSASPSGDETWTGARILGVHYEGPFVNSAQCGALHSEYFKTYSRPSDLNRLKTPRQDRAVKLITLAPEIEGGVALVSALKERGWVVSIGHTRADVNLLDLAFSAGARHMTHFMNAMSPLHHRSPGPIGWGMSRDDVTCDMIADGVHLDPRILRLLIRVKSADRLMLISDAIAAAGKGDGDYEIWGETITVENGRTRNKAGTIAGSVITMLDAVRLILSMGISPNDVGRMAAMNPAELMGIGKECGSIEEGKRADLAVLDEEMKVRLTMVGGAVAYNDV